MVLDYFFEGTDPSYIVRQKIIAELLVDGKVVGIAETFVGEVFSARSKGVTKTISVGQMTMLCEKVEKGNNKSIEFTPSVKNLNVSTSWFCFGTKSALFRIYKIKKTGDEYLLYES